MNHPGHEELVRGCVKAVPGRRAVVFGRRVAAICLLTASAAIA